MWCRRSSRTINPENCCPTITLRAQESIGILIRAGRLLQSRKHRPDHLAQCERAQCNGNGQNNLLKDGHECPLPWRLPRAGHNTSRDRAARSILLVRGLGRALKYQLRHTTG